MEKDTITQTGSTIATPETKGEKKPEESKHWYENTTLEQIVEKSMKEEDFKSFGKIEDLRAQVTKKLNDNWISVKKLGEIDDPSTLSSIIALQAATEIIKYVKTLSGSEMDVDKKGSDKDKGLLNRKRKLPSKEELQSELKMNDKNKGSYHTLSSELYSRLQNDSILYEQSLVALREKAQRIFAEVSKAPNIMSASFEQLEPAIKAVYHVLAETLVQFSNLPSTHKYHMPPIFVDSNRSSFLQHISFIFLCQSLNMPSSHPLIQSNSFCKIITGLRGLGKSTFIVAVINAITVLSSRVLPVYIDFKQKIRFPSYLIYAECLLNDVELKVNFDLDSLNILESLVYSGFRFMIFGDELSFLYNAADEEDAIETCKQLASLGNRTDGLVWVCLTGSSSFLEMLAHKHWDNSDTQKILEEYPLARKCVSLNNQKYAIIRFQPLLDQVEDESML